MSVLHKRSLSVIRPDMRTAQRQKEEETLPPMRDFGDAVATRTAIYDSVLQAAKSLPPVENAKHVLQLRDVRYDGKDRFGLTEHRNAILGGKTLGRRLTGTWELLDKGTGQVLDRKTQTVATVPYLTDDNTFVRNGIEYVVRNQLRLRPGIYTRARENGQLESHVNVMPGTGFSHHYELDPAKRVFQLRVGQAHVPLIAMLRAMGATDKQLRDSWGDDLFYENAQHDTPGALHRLASQLLSRGHEPTDTDDSLRVKIAKLLSSMPLDASVTARTLGKSYDKLDLDTVLAATKKLIAVSRGEAEPDDRDNLAYQTVHGPEDLFAERLTKDYGGWRKSLLHKASFQNSLKSLPPGTLTRQLDSLLLVSGLGMTPEEVNPADIFDKQTGLTRMGEGGIGSLDAIPESARSVQPSQFNFVDPVRTPESSRAGVDTFLTIGAKKGRDGQIYTPLVDLKTGKTVYLSPQQVSDSVVAFPGEMQQPEKRVLTLRNGRMGYALKTDVQYVPKNFDTAFSALANLVPKAGSKQQRMAMGSRFLTQALALVGAQAPLLQSLTGDKEGETYEERYGAQMGAIRAKQGGRVLSINDNRIRVRYDDGTTDEIETHRYFPYNRKSFLHQTITVKPYQTFSAGDLLARSNYTDENGATALGTNLRVGYVPFRGLNFEDAVVVSESAAKEKLRSEHMYQHALDFEDSHHRGKKQFLGQFPGRYNRAQLDTLDDDGVVKPGTILKQGDPLFVLTKESPATANKVHKKRQRLFSDASETWDHHDDGMVTDVFKSEKGFNVLVRSEAPAREGDKVSGRFGDKGVIAKIIPDSEMPRDSQGRAMEILVSPLGIISRSNPEQVIEAGLSKIAELEGKPFKLKDFDDKIEDLTEWTIDKLKQRGLSLYDDLEDPETGRKIPGILTGQRFYMKLHHMASDKLQGRSTGGYTADDAPSRSGQGNASKRLSLLDQNALLAHGATAAMEDAGAYRGQSNPDVWLQFLRGNPLGRPKVPTVFAKLVGELQAAGINVLEDGDNLNIMAMTDKDVDTLAEGRYITRSDTVAWQKDMEPIPGGLFDPTLTGGANGNRWSAIKLTEPMPSPVMEEPIRRLLDLTQKKFEAVIAGKEQLQLGEHKLSGPEAIAKALDAINVDREITAARIRIASGKKTHRDTAVRKLGYLKAAKKLGIHPRDWMLSQVPVLPPRFRPISLMSHNKQPLVADANYLYQELFDANQNLAELRKEVSDVGQERLSLYHAFKAVTGLGDPVHPKLQEKNVRGFLRRIFASSPKLGVVQRRLLSNNVDLVGRAVITPNPDLDMDHIGLPEDKAWEVYRPFVIRRLRRRGMPLVEAFKQTENRSATAKQELLGEMAARPVLANRAPVLHRHGILAFRPKLVKGDTLQISPLVVKGFNADFDGDAMQFHVPLTDEARDEYLEKLLPSRNLISSSDFKTPVHMPSQDYTGGLFFATSAQKRKPRKQTFDKLTDVWAAVMRGDLDVDELVEAEED